ncbi:TPA: HNH endonuclease [Escherichia coli]
MANKVKDINHPSINDRERRVLEELGICNGAHFNNLLKIARYRLNAGYSHAETVLSLRCTGSYIERTVMHAPKNTRKKLREHLQKFALETEQNSETVYSNYNTQLRVIREKKQKEHLMAKRKEYIRVRLESCKTRGERLMAFGLIDTIDPEYIQELEDHLAKVSHRKMLEDNDRKVKERNRLLSEMKKNSARLSERIILSEKEEPDEEASLPILVRRYIPGGRAAEFAIYARSNATLPPLEIIEGFLGYPVGGRERSQEDQPKSPPAAIMVAMKTDGIEEKELQPNIPDETTVPGKRKGSKTTVETRPDQASFAEAVRNNCYDQCVITGSRLRQRTEAAHLMEHRNGGVDHYTNGLLLRHDIHDLFDANMIAIHPVTLEVNILAEALAVDHDLAAYQGEFIKPLRKPINTEFLKHRWQVFQHRNQTEQQA